MNYDFIVVGSGLYGSVFANRAKAAGYSCLVLEKRSQVAGNVYSSSVDGIEVHHYGAHIFHTSDREVWRYAERFADFNRFINCPIANYRGEIYNLPFNMNTFHRVWGVVTPDQAKRRLELQRTPYQTSEQPQNLEQQALRLVGPELYQKLIQGYTEKQWGRPCDQLPPFIIRRIPLRFRYDNNYFDDEYQGIPKQGYTKMVQGILAGIEVRLNTDYLADPSRWDSMARHVVFTGPIDAFFGYSLGPLEYRSLRFETESLDCPDFQGNAVVNYTDAETPFTRIIEHKHFMYGSSPNTVISREYSLAWTPALEPYYPINDEANNSLYRRYAALAATHPRVSFGGRLGEYRYYNMDQAIAKAIERSTPEALGLLLNTTGGFQTR